MSGPYRVEKQSYSAGAWRVLDAHSEQVWRHEMFDHPNLGRIPLAGPVCFDRKRDALAWIAEQPLEGSGPTAVTHPKGHTA